MSTSRSKWNFKNYLKAAGYEGKEGENENQTLRYFLIYLSMTLKDVGVFSSRYTLLKLFIKNDHVTELSRSKIYDIHDLVAQFGGLLSLFLGVSLLTLVEIFYFLTLRIICNKRLYGAWAGP